MKKKVVFFVIMLVLGLLSAEEMQKETPSPDTKTTTEEKNDEKPKFFYIQPALGLSSGFMGVSVMADIDAGFLVKHTGKGINIYLGLDFDFRYSQRPGIFEEEDIENILEFPIQANLTIDFKNRNRLAPHIAFSSVWGSLGVNLFIEQAFNWHSYNYEYTGGLREGVAWGTGFSILFKSNMVFKTGISAFRGRYPQVFLLIGYRF